MARHQLGSCDDDQDRRAALKDSSLHAGWRWDASSAPPLNQAAYSLNRRRLRCPAGLPQCYEIDRL